MKLPLSFITAIFISFTLCYSQVKPAKNYVDMVINGNNLWALNAAGDIAVFDTNTGTVKTNLHTDTIITTLAVNTNGQLIVADRNNQIKLWDDKSSRFQTLAVSAVPVYQIVCNNKNEIYLVTTKGITDLKGKKYYLPDSSFYLNQQMRGWYIPSAVFTDEQNNIWIGCAHGEWGGNLFVFNTDKKKFILPVMKNLGISPVKSFFSDGRSVYVSCGLDHMFASGSILKFENYQCSPVFESHLGYRDTVEMFKLAGSKEEAKLTPMRTLVNGEYIGPAAFNQANKCIYFYCQYGIYKGDPGNDLSVIANWKKIAVPKLHWKNGQPDAVGSPMNVLKMAFAPNGKLYLITQNDGIGVYDGAKFTLLQ